MGWRLLTDTTFVFPLPNSPVERDDMVDKIRLWCARMQHMLRLEEASQEEEVMGKLRKWSREDLEREGLSVCGLTAQPAGRK